MPPSSHDQDDHDASRPSVAKRPRLAPSSRPPQHPNSSSGNLRGITDLLGAATSRADSILGDSAPQDAWSSIIKTVDGLTSSLPPDQVNPNNQDQPNNDEAPSTYKLQNLSSLPLDLSLKTRLRISSNVSLNWTRLNSQRDSYFALESVVMNHDHITTTPMTETPKTFKDGSDTSVPINTQPSNQFKSQQRKPSAHSKEFKEACSLFNRRLVHFRFPSCPQSSSLASSWQSIFSNTPSSSKPVSMSKDDGNYNRLRQEAYHRLSLFQSALQSVYYGYRYKRIPCFYVLLSNSVVIFHRSVDSASTPIALLTPASPGLRSLLIDYMVTFAIDQVDTNDLSDQVCVNVRGELNVHTLYNFIMGASHKLSGAKDVPTLICDRPFLGGTPLPASIDSAKTARTDATSSTTRYKVHIRGVLTPRQFEGVCRALSITQGSNYNVVVETESKSVGLNNLKMKDESGEDAVNNNDEETSKGSDMKRYHLQTVTAVAAFPESTGLFANTRATAKDAP